jgi:autotransporter translocation and assembly factor TamB
LLLLILPVIPAPVAVTGLFFQVGTSAESSYVVSLIDKYVALGNQRLELTASLLS